MRVGVTCPCGQDFEVAPWQVRSGRGKYCSKACLYSYRTRPSGLTYNITKSNPTSFRKGQEAWNKGVPGALNDDVSYDALHDWVARWRGRSEFCEHCGSRERVEWANRSREYRRDLDDWLGLCRKCHRAYDRGFRGAIARRWSAVCVAE